ncbi:LacI family DNA-binding transcriptional regulator [Nocardioides caldifontis]|uniref:LacI family DNA-binding transcriptional regulator n=1 Tax=Nocardioides caldifontis TaxID=2588938 RepID=UPI0011E04636|nr:LacI family DNA-binding transcriptional regulator [Nocardioides caldifontis]
MPARHRPVATLATVAAAAGVSRQTVSNALNSPELLRPDTLERVQQAIERLGYTPNRAARNLRTRSSQLVGLRLDPTTEGTVSGLMDRFLHSLAESCRGAGLHVLLFTAEDVNDPLDGYDELLRSASVDAFVVTDTYRGNPQAAWLAERQVPFVAFGRPWTEPDATHPWVDVDGRAGVMLAVDHLVDRGHQRIAWVGWQKSSTIGEDRRSGWVDRMHERGLSTSRLSARGEDTIEYGRRAAHALLDQDGEQPTAFVCVSDTVAMGVLQAIAERGRRPGPDDLAVVGFDDSPAAQVVLPGLTSVRQPLEEVAVQVVRLLEDRLAMRNIEHPHAILTPELRVRGTS